MSDYPILLAAIAGAHGVRGEVKLKLFAESLDSLTAVGTFDVDGKTLTLKSVKPVGKSLVARFAEITDRNAAETLRSAQLTATRDRLPPPDEGEYFIADLVGLPVETTDGRALGHVHAVENYGAGDILDIKRPDHSRFMLSFDKNTVPEVGAKIRVDPEYLDPDDLK